MHPQPVLLLHPYTAEERINMHECSHTAHVAVELKFKASW